MFYSLVNAPFVDLCIFRCEAVLGEFLRDIKKNPQHVNFANMVNVLVLHSQTAGMNNIQYHISNNFTNSFYQE